jgi:hypothetical protein
LRLSIQPFTREFIISFISLKPLSSPSTGSSGDEQVKRSEVTGDLPEIFAQGLVVVDLDRIMDGENSLTTCAAQGISLAPSNAPRPRFLPILQTGAVQLQLAQNIAGFQC